MVIKQQMNSCASRNRGALPVGFAISLLAAAWCQAATPTFQHEVLPIFEKRCVGCHGAKPSAGLDLRTLETIMAGSHNGAVLVPGKPDASKIWTLVHEGEMPMGGPALPEAEQAVIQEWVEKGQFPATGAVSVGPKKRTITDKDRQWWAFKKPVKPAVPAVRTAARVRTPIDAFVEAKLETKKWTIGPEADKRTLLRRAYIDLIGLPPTPEEVNQFVADTKPDAYERVIDRLLANPHYGERWGRYWLDVAGYSDSIGNSTDEVRSLSWRYRDYVIRAFNQDKPYNQFLMEQFAGDQMVNFDPNAKPRAEDVEKLTATGFLRLEPDYGDQQNIYQVDKYFDTLQITMETSLKSVLGLTFGCAKCHDHKFDPILQSDYYRLDAIFEPALDPEKWIAATSFSYGTYPSRHMLNLEPAEREAWIAQIKQEYQAVRRGRGNMTAMMAKYRKQAGGDTGAVDTDNVDAAGDTDLEAKYPEVAKAAAELKQHEEAYKKLDSARIWGLWDVSKTPAETHILSRGNYLSPAEVVQPGIPQVLDNPDKPFQFPEVKPEWHHMGRRLALAEWLTQPDHPLTARVIVNRIWQYHFGEAIVRTPDDFGSQGDKPTHPELLDWMATGFVEHGWSFKWLQKQIMLSSAYRQSSAEDPAKLAADAENKYIWRKSPVRLDAEAVRDQILQVSGQLDPNLFGEPVPVKKAADGQYVADAPKGPQRRSIYVLTRKSAPLGFLLAFDQPTMDAGNMPVRFRSALPVQSLAMMNSTFVLESSRALAARLEKDAGSDFEARIRRAYSLIYSRAPRPEELKLVHAALEGKENDAAAWREFCHALLGSTEFLYSL